MTSAGEDVKRNTLALLVKLQIGGATVESSIELPHKIKNGSSYGSVIPLLGIYLKKSKTLNEN